MLYKGVWGTICWDSWDLQDGDVVCRQLGFEGAFAAIRLTEFGPIKSQKWLDDVQCGGNESSISECVHNGWGDHKCRFYAAGVKCRPRSKAMKNYKEGPSKYYSAFSLSLECSSEVLFFSIVVDKG